MSRSPGSLDLAEMRSIGNADSMERIRYLSVIIEYKKESVNIEMENTFLKGKKYFQTVSKRVYWND